MADEVFVLNEGQALPTDFTAALSTGTFNTATSTNPFVVTKSSSHSTSENFNYYEVYDGEVSSFGGTTTAINTTSTTNAQETPGYRVQLDTGNANGFTIDTDYHYFVLVYSDSIYQHHFAKYTEQTKYDGTVYNIDFTPRLKENIPVGTQVKIFKGPLVSSSIVAAGYGLVNNTATSEERHDKFVELSRPTFYFLSGDKLEPNRKYSITKRLISGSNTVNSSSFFKTAPLTSDYILDKSFYTQNATIVDNNKTLDNGSTPQLRNTSTGTGATYTFSTTTWNDSSRNIYYSDSGHTTYLGFIDSPVRNQLIPNAINVKTKKTITNRGNYFEAKFSDVTKFLDKKINTNERVEVKEGIKRQNITYEPQATLPGIFNNHSNPSLTSNITVTGLTENQDLRELLYNSSTAKYELILIGNYYYLLSAITAPSSGSQIITISNRRAITSSTFEGSATVASMTDATAFRKEWSPVVNNFITTHSIDIEQVSESVSSSITNGSKTITVSSTNLEVGYEVIGTSITTGTTIIQIPNSTSVVVSNPATASGSITLTYRANKRNGIVVSDLEADINDLEYRIDGTNYGFSIKVKRGDLHNGYVEFEDAPTSSYYDSTDIVSSLKGKLDVNKVIFEGRIETVEKKIEMNLHYITLSGRDDIGKLLSRPVDKNYIYSEDYLYSSISPFTDGFTDTGLDISTTLNDNTVYKARLTVGGSVSTEIKWGDVLYVKFGSRYIMIGVSGSNHAVASSPSTLDLINDCLIDTNSNNYGINSGSLTIGDIYVANKKVLVGKSLETSLRHDGATTLYGSLDKGYRLVGSGKFLSSDGSQEKSTTYSSFNEDGKEIESLLITQGSSSSRKDSPIGFTFNEVTNNSIETLEFITSNNSQDLTETEIVVGYVSPIVLGRMDFNNSDSFYDNSMGMYLVNSNGLDRGGFLHLLDNLTNTDSNGETRYGPATYKNVIVDDRGLVVTPVKTNYFMRFGSPIFRFNNLVQSSMYHYRRYKRELDRFSDGSSNDTVKSSPPSGYEDNFSGFNFYTTSFRIEGSSSVSRTFYSDTVNSNLKDLPVSYTGYYPAVGSTHIDLTTFPESYRTSHYNYGRLVGYATNGTPFSILDNKERVEIDDPSIVNPFLFILGDALPVNKKRKDSLFNQDISKNLAGYYAMVKFKPSKSSTSIGHRNYIGNTQLETLFDSDYKFFPINSVSNTNPLRMNLMRLRTMTVDKDFNEINYELSKNKTTLKAGPKKIRQEISHSLPRGGLSLYKVNITTNTSSSSTTIVVDDATDLNKSVGGTVYHKVLYTSPSDDSTGFSRLLGTVSSIASASPPTTITLAANCAVDGYSGEVYVSDGANEHQSESLASIGGGTPGHTVIAPNYFLAAGRSLGSHANYEVLENAAFVRTTVSSSQSQLNPKFLRYGFTNSSNRDTISITADLRITNIAGSGTNTATITFSNNAGGVAPDLQYFSRNNEVITVAGHSNSNFNIDYSITGRTSNSLTVSTVSSSNPITGESADTSDVSCTITSPRYRHVVVNPYRLENDGGYVYYSSSAEEQRNGIYTGMKVVVVDHSSPKGATPSLQAELSNLNQANNYGTTITESAVDYEDTTTSKWKLYTTTYLGNLSSRDLVSETADVELLYVPVIDVGMSNISVITGTNASPSDAYTGKTFIAIDVDYTEKFERTVGSLNATTTFSRWIHYIGDLTGKYLHNDNDGTLHYIKHHHISKQSSGEKFRHFLEVDNGSGIGSSDKLTVLSVCSLTTQRDKTAISLYDYSQTNVINPSTGRFYENETPKRNWAATTLTTNSVTFTDTEAIVKGMYVLMDCDSAGSAYMVHRNTSNSLFTADNNYSVCLTDGRDKLDTGLSVKTRPRLSGATVLTYIFPEMKTFYGSVSVGEIFTIKAIGRINSSNVESIKIVSPLQIQTEVEEIADDIISSIGLTYNKSADYGTTDHDKYYIGSNFDGQDSFTAVNSVLDYKGLKLKIDGETFDIVSNESAKEYRSIELTEDSIEYNITSFKRDISLYDKFNSVVVIGDDVRGIAKNHSEIEADGSEKIKEIYDFSITGQEQANERAMKMLRAFSTLSNAIQIGVASDLPHIEPGQIITLKFEREGIFRGEYAVIEVVKESGYPTKLLLGEYTKDLSATLSLLLGETRNLQGRNKQVYKSYASPSISLQTVRLKFVKATITKNTGVSTTVLGFGSTIGFDMGLGL